MRPKGHRGSERALASPRPARPEALAGSRSRAIRASLALGLALAAVPTGLSGQDVRLAERPRSEAQRRLEAFLERGGFELWTRDTVLARGDTVRSSVLVLEGSARIAGRVAGDLYVVDGDLFLRTRGSIGGDVVVIGGGFYGSDLAEVAGTTTYRPGEQLRVMPEAGGYLIFPVRERLPAIELDGQYGFRGSSYQRVDAVTLSWGGLARAEALPGRPELELVGRYKTGPEKFEGSARASWYAGSRVRVGLSASRATRSNEDWIRPDWYNSLATLFTGDDARDYHRADRGQVELEVRSTLLPDWRTDPRWSLTLSAGWEEARSLRARDVFVLLESDEARPNPEIDPGDGYSARAAFHWRTGDEASGGGVGLGLEAASRDVAGDFSFLLGEARATARGATSWGHTWEFFAIGRADLAGTLPAQRWSSIGGIGTLPAVPMLALRGERLLFGEAAYGVPLATAGRLARAELFVRGSAGAAWSEGEPLRLEENVTLGLRARLWSFGLELGAAAGPAPRGDPEGGLDVLFYFDVRVDRSARPSAMVPPGRRF